MSRCERCGLQLPEGAAFCPNCGATVKKREIAFVPPSKPLTNFLRIGIMGAFLSVLISSFSLVPLYFVPSFISSLIVIYLFKVKRIEDATIVSMSLYLFENAIGSGLIFISGLVEGETELYVTYTLVDLLIFAVYPITALLAGYIGANIVPNGKKETSAGPYGERDEKGPGGIVYCLKGNTEGTVDPPNNV